MMSRLLTPSIVCYDGTLSEAADTVGRLGCSRVHIDVTVGGMLGGLFRLDSFTLGNRALFSTAVDLHVFDFRPVWVHGVLPLRAGDSVIIHCFPWSDLTTIQQFMDAEMPVGIRRGLSLDVDGAIETILPIASLFDTIVVMGTKIGGRGLPLNRQAIERLRQLRSLDGPPQLVIDGGVNLSTLPELIHVADTIIVGGLLFNAPDLEAQWEYLQRWLRSMS